MTHLVAYVIGSCVRIESLTDINRHLEEYGVGPAFAPPDIVNPTHVVFYNAGNELPRIIARAATELLTPARERDGEREGAVLEVDFPLDASSSWFTSVLLPWVSERIDDPNKRGYAVLA